MAQAAMAKAELLSFAVSDACFMGQTPIAQSIVSFVTKSKPVAHIGPSAINASKALLTLCLHSDRRYRNSYVAKNQDCCGDYSLVPIAGSQVLREGVEPSCPFRAPVFEAGVSANSTI
jgi:hypothetical protein